MQFSGILWVSVKKKTAVNQVLQEFEYRRRIFVQWFLATGGGLYPLCQLQIYIPFGLFILCSFLTPLRDCFRLFFLGFRITATCSIAGPDDSVFFYSFLGGFIIAIAAGQRLGVPTIPGSFYYKVSFIFLSSFYYKYRSVFVLFSLVKELFFLWNSAKNRQVYTEELQHNEKIFFLLWKFKVLLWFIVHSLAVRVLGPGKWQQIVIHIPTSGSSSRKRRTRRSYNSNSIHTSFNSRNIFCVTCNET